MKSLQITLIVIGFILLALMATNPAIDEHRQAVKEKMGKILTQSSNLETGSNLQKLGNDIGDAVGQSIVEKTVSRENLILFSLTKITLRDSSRYIGLGFFGNIFIWDKDDHIAFKNNETTDNLKNDTSIELISEFTHEDVEKLDELSFATEGTDFSENVNSYKQKKYIVSNYGVVSYMNINNKIEVLNQLSFKKLSKGFIQSFSNNDYKLVLTANKVEPLTNPVMEGMVKIEGNLELFNSKGDLVQTMPYFYGEGF